MFALQSFYNGTSCSGIPLDMMAYHQDPKDCMPTCTLTPHSDLASVWDSVSLACVSNLDIVPKTYPDVAYYQVKFYDDAKCQTQTATGFYPMISSDEVPLVGQCHPWHQEDSKSTRFQYRRNRFSIIRFKDDLCSDYSVDFDSISMSPPTEKGTSCLAASNDTYFKISLH